MYAVFYRLNTNWKDKPLTQFTQFIWHYLLRHVIFLNI
jgi:hypothetical protein